MASFSSNEWKAVCAKFTNAQQLSDVESRTDPENDPFRSKYKARELLTEIYCSLKNFEAGDGEEHDDGETSEPEPTEELLDGEKPVDLDAFTRLAAVEYYLGVNHVDTEELSAGQEHLMNCMKHLGKCRVSSENVSLFIHVRNQLGILWAGRDETEKSQGFLETAESIYQRYMKENGSPPTDMTEYFCSEENQLTHQERTKNYSYRTCPCCRISGENERAANYCYSTLQRQLQLNQFNPMEWALNAATLSQYYITKGQYMEGRHCLAAATVISGLAGEVPSEAAAQESMFSCQHSTDGLIISSSPFQMSA
uniref:KIF-binding protein n=1 Tax=Oryzias latipes TaxID=8090 RepID=A0A3P9H1P1_ORYLA